MINLSKLNKKKTYVGFNIGEGIFSKLIQIASRDDTDLPIDQIATHVFALAYRQNNWYVYEAHIQWDGCKKLLYGDWVKDYDLNKVFCYERPLNIEALEFYCNPLFSPQYSKVGIAELALEDLTDKHLWKDSGGVVCSKLIALADKGFKLCYKLGLPPWDIKPVHWQIELI